MSSYLLQRPTGWYFKRAVPRKLVDIVGRAVWRETLKASTRARAEIAVRPLIASTNEEIRKAREELHRQRQAMTMLTPEERAILLDGGGFAGLRKATDAERQSLPFAKAAADMLASAELTAEGINRDELEDEIDGAERFLSRLRTRIARNDSILARKGLKPSEALHPDELTPLPGEAPNARGDIDLPTLVAEWVKQKQPPKQHADQYRYPVKLFTEWHGVIPLRAITKDHVRDWRNALQRLPRSTKAKYRQATMRQAIVQADRDAIARITPQTGAKHLSALKTLFKFAVSEGYLDNSPAEGISYPTPKGKFSERDERKPFDLEQRRTLFATLAAQYAATEDDYWIPLVGLYQAMREEEICQLERRDIQQNASGIWVINVTDEGEGRKVKNKPSVRTIPLAKQLIATGFLAHVERSPGPRVFHSLAPDQRGRLAGPYGKRFARHLRKRAKITDSELVFHSLRGTWKDAARNAGVPLDVQERIMGHTYGGNPVAAKYGAGHSIEVLADWMAKVDPLPPIG